MKYKVGDLIRFTKERKAIILIHSFCTKEEANRIYSIIEVTDTYVVTTFPKYGRCGHRFNDIILVKPIILLRK